MVVAVGVTVTVEHPEPPPARPHPFHRQDGPRPLAATLVGLRRDVLVGLAQHGDQHVDEQDGHQNHVDTEEQLGQVRVRGGVELVKDQRELVEGHHVHGDDGVEQVDEIVALVALVVRLEDDQEGF